MLIELALDIRDLLVKVIETMEGWASPDSTVEFVIAITQVMRQHQRYQTLLPVVGQV